MLFIDSFAKCDCGDYTEDTPSWINGVITNYLPPRLLKTRTEELMKQYMELKGVPKDEAKRALMETVVAVPLFGYSVFTVSVRFICVTTRHVLISVYSIKIPELEMSSQAIS